jgi:2-octaprenylphenol hydroxylase
VRQADYDIVIVGAGMAGASLALCLRGSGLRIALIEGQPIAQSTKATVDGVHGYDSRVSAITPASRDLFKRLDVWPQITAARNCAYRHMVVWDGEGTGGLNFHSDDMGLNELGYIIENRLITSALLHAVRDAPEIKLLNPLMLDALVCEEDVVVMDVSDGSQICASLLVAADGALSRVRTLADFRSREWDYGHHALVATVQLDEPHGDTAWQCFTKYGPLAFLPLSAEDGGHYVSVVWSSPPEHNAELLALSDAEFCLKLSQGFQHRLGAVRSTSRRASFPLRQRHATDYVKPRIALVGDAAHTIHPLAGQGINLGLQDVAVLSEELLIGAQRGLSPGDLPTLLRYQRRRKSDNLLMMAAMDGLKNLFEQRALPLRWIRNTGLRMLDGAPALKRQIMRHAMGLPAGVDSL